MAIFTIIYNENGTVSRILEFMGRSFSYEWNRTDMTHPDFCEQVLAVIPSLAGTYVDAVLHNLSYYNDDLPGQVGALTDFEKEAVMTDAVTRIPP